jgi:hypothetical protein
MAVIVAGTEAGTEDTVTGTEEEATTETASGTEEDTPTGGAELSSSDHLPIIRITGADHMTVKILENFNVARGVSCVISRR